METTVHNEVPVKFESLHIESRRTKIEDVIAFKKSKVRCEGVGHERSVDYGRRLVARHSKNIYSNGRPGIQPVAYSVVEHVIMDLVRKEAIKETLIAHVAKFIDTNAADEQLPKQWLTSPSLITPIPTFSSCKKDTAMETKKCSTTLHGMNQ